MHALVEEHRAIRESGHILLHKLYKKVCVKKTTWPFSDQIRFQCSFELRKNSFKTLREMKKTFALISKMIGTFLICLIESKGNRKI